MISRQATRRLSFHIVALATTALAGACGGSSSPGATTAAEPAAPARPDVIQLTDDAMKNAGITVQPVRVLNRAERIVAPGLLDLNEERTARIGALQEGLIVQTTAQVGDRVGTRQVLARMHSHDMHDAWAGFRKALAERRRAQNARTFAVEAHERAQRLFADKAVSLQEVQRAEVERVAAVQAVDVAQAEVLRSVEELEHVGVDVSPDAPTAEEATKGEQLSEQIPIRSPLGGVVLERLITQGTTVTPGTALFVVSELSTLWAIAEVDEALLSRVKTGQPVGLSVAAYPGETFTGTITFVADTVNPKTRRITVRSTVPNPDGRLKPQMFATVSLGEGPPRPVPVVPEAAVQTIDGQSVVFVERAPGRFVPQPVTVGPTDEGQVDVVSGLAEGDRVAVAGAFALKSELLKTSAGDE